MTEGAAEGDAWRENGGPEPPRREEGPARWGPRRTLAAVAIALAVGAAGSVSVTAITSGSAEGRMGGPGGGGAPGANSGGGFGRMGRAGGTGAGSQLSDAMHAEFTVETEQDTYRTKRLQRGTVTAVDETNITVRSADGYRREYVVSSETVVDDGRATVDELERGRNVTVVATLSGGEATATTISGQRSGGPGSGAGKGGFGGRGGNGTPGSGSGSASGGDSRSGSDDSGGD